ncbi:MAG: hypothetical protein ACE5HU_07220 [Acidobacteriota bacterium]
MARTSDSLLEALQRIIEKTYDLETGVRDIGRFVIGDEGYRAIYGRLDAAGVILDKVGAGTAGAGAKTLLRRDGRDLAVSIYYPDSLVRCLERNDPTRRLDESNVDAFNQLVEELDHFLVIAERFLCGAAMSLLDLELHANVTKYLMLKMFLGKMCRATRLPAGDTAWIHFQVFGKGEFADPDPEVRSRYQQARRLGARYVRAIDALRPAERIAELRRFHRLAPRAKIAHMNGAD